MAYGTANVDVIQSSTAGTPPQFNDGNGTRTGTLCRAWVNFGYVASAMTTRGSFNVTSVTRSGTGAYTVNYSTNFPDSNYAVSIGGINVQNGLNVTLPVLNTLSAASTTLNQVPTGSGAGGSQDTTLFCIAVFR